MERAWETMKFEDTSLPQVSFDKSNRHIREMIIEHTRQYKRPFTNEKIETSQCEKILNVKDTSQYELPITIEILFVKIIVRGPRKCELVRKQASANDLRHLT